ncbi:MAG: type II secretion system protein GspM [Candidatus Thiodiazotropha sp.]
MISRLDRRQSRLLALLLFNLTLLSAVAAIVLPAFLMNRHFDERIKAMQDQLEVYQRVARHSAQYQAKYQRLQRVRRQDRRYLQSDTESLATAELQRIVKQMIAGNQGEILSTQVMQATEEQGFTRISIRVRMKSRLQEMVKIFYAMESRKPYLFVEDVIIRSRQVARRRLPSNKAIAEAMAQLDVDFQLSGYMRADPS